MWVKDMIKSTQAVLGCIKDKMLSLYELNHW